MTPHIQRDGGLGVSVNSGNGPASLEQLPGYVLRPYHGHEDHGAMAAVRLGCAERDRIDARSVVEGLPTAAEIAEASAKLDDPSEYQALVEHNGGVVGYSTIRRWQERDGTWLYLHRGYLLPEHRGQGIGSAMLNWAESRIHQLVQQHGTAQTAVLGANAMASQQDATALLLDSGYRRVFSLVELELPDLRQLPDGKPLPAGVRVGAVDPSSYRAAWKTVVDSYAEAAFTERWTFESFLATGTANPHRSYDLYEGVGFRRQNEYVRYRKPISV